METDMSHNERSPEGRLRNLLADLGSMGRVAVAFSGGLDSTFLLHAARAALGDNVLAVTLATPYMPEAELGLADRTARDQGIAHRIIEAPIPESIRSNPPDRCYLCKKSLFTMALDVAASVGIIHVLDGTNLDDMGDHRPGLRALRELRVYSPLLAARLTKQDIRELSRKQGLPTWDLPAGACLLTRLPHGTRVDEAELRRIDRAESLLKSLGFPAVRVRSHGDLARIEVPRDRVAELVEADGRHDMDARLKALGYRHITVDLAGYRMGNLNDTTPPDGTR